jgi:tetratricopeptide (TPR) repeat protein
MIIRPVMLVAALALWPALARAQQDSILPVAVRLATEGQTDSARALVRAQLGRLTAADAAYPEALFAAGVVAGDMDSAQTYFRRVSIEFSGSPWADEALLRLAQLAFAQHDYAGAQRTAERLLSDYPFSDILAEAGYWAGRAHLELGDLGRACPHLRAAEAGAGANVELANRLRFYLQRCGGVAAADTAAAPPAPRPDQAQGPRFSVQIAALQSASAADEVMRDLSARGYEVRAVRDGGFLKIRVGSFARRTQADALLAELRRVVGGQPFVVEEP